MGTQIPKAIETEDGLNEEQSRLSLRASEKLRSEWLSADPAKREAFFRPSTESVAQWVPPLTTFGQVGNVGNSQFVLNTESGSSLLFDKSNPDSAFRSAAVRLLALDIENHDVANFNADSKDILRNLNNGQKGKQNALWQILIDAGRPAAIKIKDDGVIDFIKGDPEAAEIYKKTSNDQVSAEFQTIPFQTKDGVRGTIIVPPGFKRGPDQKVDVDFIYHGWGTTGEKFGNLLKDQLVDANRGTGPNKIFVSIDWQKREGHSGSNDRKPSELASGLKKDKWVESVVNAALQSEGLSLDNLNRLGFIAWSAGYVPMEQMIKDLKTNSPNLYPRLLEGAQEDSHFAVGRGTYHEMWLRDNKDNPQLSYMNIASSSTTFRRGRVNLSEQVLDEGNWVLRPPARSGLGMKALIDKDPTRSLTADDVNNNSVVFKVTKKGHSEIPNSFTRLAVAHMHDHSDSTVAPTYAAVGPKDRPKQDTQEFVPSTAASLKDQDAPVICTVDWAKTGQQFDAHCGAFLETSPINPLYPSFANFGAEFSWSPTTELNVYPSRTVISPNSGQANQTFRFSAPRESIQTHDRSALYTPPQGAALTGPASDLQLLDRTRWFAVQPDQYGCGATALAMARAQYVTGRRPTVREIKQLEEDTGTLHNKLHRKLFPGGADLMAKSAINAGLGAKPYNYGFNKGAQAMDLLDAEFNLGHGAIAWGLNKHTGHGHWYFIAGRTQDGRYVLGDPGGTTRTYARHLHPVSRAHLAELLDARTGFVAVWRKQTDVAER